MDYDYDPQEHFVNYQNVANHKGLCNVTRVLAMDLINNPYIVVGDFFKNLSNGSLKELIELINRDDDDAVSEVLLLSEMLSRAEGVENGIEDMGTNIGVMRMLVAGTSLARKGLVRAHYENMTFGKEMEEKILFEKINDDH